MQAETVVSKWWKKKFLRLPVWAWIIVVFIGVPAVFGQGGDDTTSTSGGSSTESSVMNDEESSDSSIDESTAPTGPKLTKAQENAVRAAENYLRLMGFSRQGLIDQLSSEYGDQYNVEDAIFAVDSLDVDWNAEAVQSAESYLETSSFSCQGLIDQLSSEFGSQFTREQATYAATEVGLC